MGGDYPAHPEPVTKRTSAVKFPIWEKMGHFGTFWDENKKSPEKSLPPLILSLSKDGEG